MVKKKRQSKRLKLKDKYKIKRKVAEHNKKLKKLAKKNPRLRAPKEPPMPNSWPIKDDIINHFMNQKQESEALKLKKKEEKKLLRKQEKELMQKLQQKQQNKSLSDVESLLSEVSQNIQTGGDKTTATAPESKETKESPKQRAYNHFQQIISMSDVILEILDARDPIGSRSLEVENYIKVTYPKKQLVLVLNKSDMIPRNNVREWLTFLRQEYPTVVFKSSVKPLTVVDKEVARITNGNDSKHEKSSGGNIILEMLRNFRVSQNLDHFTVGVIGYPDVGKSSFINSFQYKKRATATFHGSSSLFTGLALDKNILLLDSPGVIFTDTTPSEPTLSCIISPNVPDPLPTVEAILKQFSEVLLPVYKIASFSNLRQFLHFVAEKKGKLRDGNFDEKVVARAIIRDWNSGKIPHYTLPPGEERVPGIYPWSDAFKLSELLELENNTINSLKKGFLTVYSRVVPSTPIVPHSAFKKLLSDQDEILKDLLQEDQQEEEKKKKYQLEKKKSKYDKKRKHTTTNTEQEQQEQEQQEREEGTSLVSEQDEVSSKKVKANNKANVKQDTGEDYDFSDFWTNPNK